MSKPLGKLKGTIQVKDCVVQPQITPVIYDFGRKLVHGLFSYVGGKAEPLTVPIGVGGAGGGGKHGSAVTACV